MSQIEDKLQAMGIILPDAPAPLGNFLPFLIDGSHLHISGQISVGLDGKPITGQIGADYSVEHGYEAARFCAINLLARARAALGDLDRIERLIKLGGFINSEAGFSQHPKVLNGASDLFAEILGPDKAGHVRFAVGSSSLPANASVEIEAIFRITD
ncbi:RidA family protein [Roseibium sp.]|uniref:RidA family protein n=1 Tax=Roseibium sp. TaxID=1936156 RepID=UPI003BB1EE60